MPTVHFLLIIESRVYLLPPFTTNCGQSSEWRSIVDLRACTLWINEAPGLFCSCGSFFLSFHWTLRYDNSAFLKVKKQLSVFKQTRTRSSRAATSTSLRRDCFADCWHIFHFQFPPLLHQVRNFYCRATFKTINCFEKLSSYFGGVRIRTSSQLDSLRAFLCVRDENFPQVMCLFTRSALSYCEPPRASLCVIIPEILKTIRRIQQQQQHNNRRDVKISAPSSSSASISPCMLVFSQMGNDAIWEDSLDNSAEIIWRCNLLYCKLGPSTAKAALLWSASEKHFATDYPARFPPQPPLESLSCCHFFGFVYGFFFFFFSEDSDLFKGHSLLKST